MDADDGGGVGRLPPRTVLERGDDHTRAGARLLRVSRRDPAALGRHGAEALGLVGAGRRPLLRGHVRAGRGPRPEERDAAGGGPAPGHGAGDLRAQVGGRAGGDRPGRAHARDHGRRARRHPRLPGRGDPTRAAGAGAWPQSRPQTERAGLRPHPARHLPGRRPVPARSRAAGQRGRDAATARAGGRRRTRPCGASICTPPPWWAGWPRPRWRSSWGTGSRPTGPVRAARALADRRRPRRGPGRALEAGGRDRRGGGRTRASPPTRPAGGRPRHPEAKRHDRSWMP